MEPALLAVLASGEAHGYGIAQAIEELTDGGICLDPGGVYRTLRRLEDDGCVISDWVEGGSGPQRRQYTITDEGLSLLSMWTEDLRARARSLDAIADAADTALRGKERD